MPQGDRGTGAQPCAHGLMSLRRGCVWLIQQVGSISSPRLREHQPEPQRRSAAQEQLSSSKGLFLEPSEDTLTVVAEEGGRDM